MQENGRQKVLLNDWDKKAHYYQKWSIEELVRDKAKDFPNTYSILVFACCREFYNPENHCGGFDGTKLIDEAYKEAKKAAT